MYGSARMRTYYGAGDYQGGTAIGQALALARTRVRAAPPRSMRRYRMTFGAYQAGGFFSSVWGAVKKYAAPALNLASSFVPGGSLLGKAMSVVSKVAGPKASASSRLGEAIERGTKDFGPLSVVTKKTAKRMRTESFGRPRRRGGRGRIAGTRRRAARRRSSAPRGDARDSSGRWVSPGGGRSGPYPHSGHSHRRRRRRSGGRVTFRTKDGRTVSFTARR